MSAIELWASEKNRRPNQEKRKSNKPRESKKCKFSSLSDLDTESEEDNNEETDITLFETLYKKNCCITIKITRFNSHINYLQLNKKFCIIFFLLYDVFFKAILMLFFYLILYFVAYLWVYILQFLCTSVYILYFFILRYKIFELFYALVHMYADMRHNYLFHLHI